MRRIAPLLLGMGLLLGLAAPSQAGQVLIGFDFSGSTISVLGGAINIPPDGSITSASATLHAQSAGTAPTLLVAPGSAALANLTLAATVNANVFGNVITGGVGANGLAPAAGSLTAGLNNAIFGGSLALTGLINCAGAGCTVLGLPTSLTGTQYVAFGSVPIGSINNVGNATMNGLFSLTIGGFTAVLNLVGTEVSRTFVPEPNTFGLVALGMAGLAGARARRRRQR